MRKPAAHETDPRDISHYILLASGRNQPVGGEVPAVRIFRTLLDRGSWYLAPHTPHRQLYKPGDKLLFYLSGNGNRCFTGTACVADKPRRIDPTDSAMLADLALLGFDLELPLVDIQIWQTPVLIKPLVRELSFIRNKGNYALHLLRGSVRIPERDYRLIVDSYVSQQTGH